MKYIVIGLGYFGAKLATILTSVGHEVIGIDNHSERLDELKDSITTVMKMDSTNINAIKSLPLRDTDAVIVAIGEDVGASILTLSILKNLKVKRIIGRAINQLHQNILNQIGVEEIILPLEEAANHVSSMLQLKNTLRIVEISDDYAIVEVYIPEKYIGHSLETVDIEERFNLKLVAVKTPPEDGIITSIFRRNYTVDLSYNKTFLLRDNDILVLAGKIVDLKRFIES
ncbi:MAG: TrkA family potassium uptake protein [Bacteroidales bacterium]|nr:TrkA family potassium uptake protein [Bacteroidales bacterium]MBK7628872.1 TrkA family potassium uptake protein [Bacteroidales bacterium]